MHCRETRAEMSLRKEEEICVIIISWILLMNTFPLPIGYEVVL